ncbi:PREDICTED: probable F-box protein At1g60180 [Tarenaya hassleriana]|uniref:probable F-box protein At1g60180 n=1 Tax=Tarenaya hassleriana TaxID=28532 RepID=UPI00053C2BDC|nr:PREDICTED: probable F-box protein At1g60180 [Tarenaya hassleriana]
MARTTTAPPQISDSGDRISDVHQDIIETQILTRLDGLTLASLSASISCVSSQLHDLAYDETLWSKLCHSMWPSTADPAICHVISSFPGGSRSFFSDTYSVITGGTDGEYDRLIPKLISAVDLHYRGKLIFSKVVETDTTTAWFQSSPLRIDLVDPKDMIATSITRRRSSLPENESTCRDLEEDMTLSWIVIDPIGRRAANLSSYRPVSVQRHWFSGEIHARFVAVVSGASGVGGATEEEKVVECGITVVTCGEGEMHVREVNLQVEDMEGMHLNGSDTLVILRRAMEGERGNGKMREEGGRRRHVEFMEERRERKEMKLRAEWVFDILSVAVGVLCLASFGFYLWWL